MINGLLMISEWANGMIYNDCFDEITISNLCTMSDNGDAINTVFSDITLYNHHKALNYQPIITMKVLFYTNGKVETEVVMNKEEINDLNERFKELRSGVDKNCKVFIETYEYIEIIDSTGKLRIRNKDFKHLKKVEDLVELISKAVAHKCHYPLLSISRVTFDGKVENMPQQLVDDLNKENSQLIFPKNNNLKYN